jgi:AcrR family transcriptional regulator
VAKILFVHIKVVSMKKSKELQARSKATQPRSREKKEILLAITKKLIGTKGSSDVSMREIAKLAGLPIATVYHYYPNKDAILAEIMQSVFDQNRTQMELLFYSIQKREDLKHIINAAVDNYFKTFEEDPSLAIIWANIQASPVLAELDMLDTRKTAQMITDTLTRKFPGFDRDETLTACFSLLGFATYLSRMVIYFKKEEAKKLQEELKITIALRIEKLLTN